MTDPVASLTAVLRACDELLAEAEEAWADEERLAGLREIREKLAAQLDQAVFGDDPRSLR